MSTISRLRARFGSRFERGSQALSEVRDQSPNLRSEAVRPWQPVRHTNEALHL